MEKGVQIFLSYTHRDRPLEQELLKHLTLLQRQGQVTIWSTDDIIAGQNYTQTISDRLNSSQIILFLVSSDFLFSKEFEYVVPKAIEKQQAGEAQVIPIILRPVDWKETPFSQLQVLPRNGRALTQWTSRDLAYLDIIEGIREAIENFTSPKKQNEEDWLKKMLATFTDRELNLLIFDLGVFLSKGQDIDTNGIIAYMKSQNRLQELVTYVRKRRSTSR